MNRPLRCSPHSAMGAGSYRRMWRWCTEAGRRALACFALEWAGLAAGAVYLQFVRWEVEPRTGLAEMLAGVADRPFVTRALAPLIIRAMVGLTAWHIERAAAALAYGAMVAWLLALWWLAAAVLGRRAALVAAVCGAGPVLLLFISGAYVYDLPTLALFTLALGLLARRQWAAYLALFPIIALCRETSILLVPVFYLWRRQYRPIRRCELAAGLGVQVFAFVAIRYALAYVYRNNGGALLEMHLIEHWYFLTYYPHANILALAVYGLALAAALTRWREQPGILRAAAVIIPIIFAAYWLVGFPGEIRVVLEAYPPLYLLAFGTVWRRGVLPARARLAVRRRPLSPQMAILQAKR